MIKKTLTALCFLLAITLSHHVMAEDEGLYEKTASPEDGFVRVVNISPTQTMEKIMIGTLSVDTLSPHSISDYVFLKAGDIEINLDGHTTTIPMIAEHYYTVIKNADHSFTVLEDVKSDKPNKAVINFYNLSDIASVSLVSTTHNADIFKNVETNKSQGRDINAVTLGVSIKNGDTVIATREELKLERQIGTSLFLINHPDEGYDLLVKNNAY